MKTNDFIKEILLALIRKKNKRNLKFGEKEISRSIIVRPKDFYSRYGTESADATVENKFNEAVSILEKKSYVKVDRVVYSDDIKKISLNIGRELDIENFLNDTFGITPRYFIVEETKELIEKYKNKGKLTEYYSNQLLYKVERTVNDVEIEIEEKIFSILDFIQNNKVDLYIREVSMIVFGSSKIFEEQPFYNNICTIVRNATNKPADEDSAIDDILKDFHITTVDQDILLKGDIIISISGYELSIKNLSNGVSLTSSDIPLIDYIEIKTESFMTIENKTAFYRFDDNCFSVMYLGGFANRHQVEILKRIINDNPNKKYFHFGDIDIGGFFIHQHLCRSTGKEFNLYHMGVDELHNPQFKKCLTVLSGNDRERAKSLVNIQLYNPIIHVMLDENIKLEQEIICLSLQKKKYQN